MADQDCNKINLPLALSSSTPSWWDLHHHATRLTPSTNSWNNTGTSAESLPWESHYNSNSSSCDQEDISISASNLSSLTADRSSHPFLEPSSATNNIIGEPAPAPDNNSHLWNQLLLCFGSSQEMRNHEMGENLVTALSSKSSYGGMFEPSACGDHLMKFNSHRHDKCADIYGDLYPNFDTTSFFTNNSDKQSNDNGDSNLMENNDHQRSFIKLSTSNLVNGWSIAPPDQSQVFQQLVPDPCSNHIPTIDQYLHLDITTDQTKQNLAYQPHLFDMGLSSGMDCANSGYNQMRPENDRRGESVQVGCSPATLFPKALFDNNIESGYRPVGANWRPRESNMLSHHGSVIDPFSDPRSRFLSKPVPKSFRVLDARKQQGTPDNSLMNKGNGREQGASKRYDDTCQSSRRLKKPRHESSGSNLSSAKMTNSETPKGKITAENISTLQQIVSPYGKTDTASVLQEAIGLIKRLQENVQLLSNPYLKSSVTKLQEAWRGLDKKHEGGERKMVFELKSKGLCLVPISRIPRDIKEDNSGPDYWPTYSGYLYR